MLVATETERLTELETVIERGLQTFVEVGNALMEIRDGRLYRAEHDTFENYCRERWGMGRNYVNKLIAASGVVLNLGTIVPKDELPQTETQARPLSQLTPDQRREVWPVVVETAPDGHITANHVESVVKDFITPNPKPKLNRAGDMYMPQGFDACQTPPAAIGPLLPHLVEGWKIWEPAAGEGNLVNAFRGFGFDVIASDLINGANFFEFEPETWDCLITNPPYSIKYQWLERCYQLSRPFALLLPVETLGARSAQVFFEQYGVEVIFLDRRVNFKMPNIGWDGSSAQFPTAWFTNGLEIGKRSRVFSIAFAKLEGQK